MCLSSIHAFSYLLVRGQERVDVGPVCSAKSMQPINRNVFVSYDDTVDYIFLAVVSPKCTFSYPLAVAPLDY